ncbi:MAG TPA: tetratricopeptide repeat protein [Vicinamibacterales bacterium]|nr:tetratricopeptide repeat protein [Vicinamibacterales bacterium]
MKKTIAVSALTLVLSILGNATAGAQNREHQQMTAELRMLQEQTQQLALSLAQIGEAIKALNARLDSSDQSAQKRFADQELLLKGLSTELSAVRERTQDTDTRLRSLADEIEALRSSVTSLSSGAPSPGPLVPGADTSSAPTSPGTASPATSISTAGLSPSRMLERARGDYFSGAYAAAITGFEELVKAFPKTEAAAEGYYYLGETHFTQKRFQDAATAYTQVIQTYPKSSWVPDAYFKRGRAYEALNQPAEARASYEQLVKTFADSAPAGLAKQRLDALARQGAATSSRP